MVQGVGFRLFRVEMSSALNNGVQGRIRQAEGGGASCPRKLSWVYCLGLGLRFFVGPRLSNTSMGSCFSKVFRVRPSSHLWHRLQSIICYRAELMLFSGFRSAIFPEPFLAMIADRRVLSVVLALLIAGACVLPRLPARMTMSWERQIVTCAPSTKSKPASVGALNPKPTSAQNLDITLTLKPQPSSRPQSHKVSGFRGFKNLPPKAPKQGAFLPNGTARHGPTREACACVQNRGEPLLRGLWIGRLEACFCLRSLVRSPWGRKGRKVSGSRFAVETCCRCDLRVC